MRSDFGSIMARPAAIGHPARKHSTHATLFSESAPITLRKCRAPNASKNSGENVMSATSKCALPTEGKRVLTECSHQLQTANHARDVQSKKVEDAGDWILVKCLLRCQAARGASVRARL